MIRGSDTLDFDALEKVTKYDGYKPDSAYMKAFWGFVKSFSEEDKKKFLFFTTGSDRAPIKGLGSFDFFVFRSGPDTNQLPTSHTCFNHLLLPEYSSIEKMKEKLIYAINHSQGFGLR